MVSTLRTLKKEGSLMQYGPFETSREFDKLMRRIGNLFSQGHQGRAQKELQVSRPSMSKESLLVSYFLEGECFVKVNQWEQAQACYRQAWKMSVSFPLQSRREQLDFLAASYVGSLFFCQSVDKALTMARKVSKLANWEVLRWLSTLAKFCASRHEWEKELGLCEIFLDLELSCRQRNRVLLNKAEALTRMRRVMEARALFYQVMHAQPVWSEPYEWLGVLFLVEGRDKADYFLKTAWKLGAREVGFCRNLFLLTIIEDQKPYAQLLDVLANESDKALEFLTSFLCELNPRFFQLLMKNFSVFMSNYQAPKGSVRQHLRFLERMRDLLQGVQRRYEELRRYIIPLVEEYWQCQALDPLSYYECLTYLTKFNDVEERNFLELYGDALEREEFHCFLTQLREQKVIVGLLLLRFSYILDLFAEVGEERGREISCSLHFDSDQWDLFQYKSGVITFGVATSFAIPDKEELKTQIRSYLSG